MKIIECEQGTAEWHAAKLGKVSASRVADLTAKVQKGYAASRANYMAEIVAERLTGQTQEKYTNAAMQWGTEKEPEARAVYELDRDVAVTKIGLALHPTIDMACASPDGLIGEDGLIEIKCPGTATHIDTLLRGEIDGKYLKQMQWQLACTGRLWCDFVSFDPRMPGDMQLFVSRVHRNDVMIVELEDAVRLFLFEVEATINNLVSKYRQEAA